MARAGRKRKLKPREPSGRIKKTARDPVVWTLPPIEQMSKREAILGSKSARGEISEPFVHITPMLSDIQIEVAQEFQKLARRARLRTEGPKGFSCPLGDLQPRGALSSLYEEPENEIRALRVYDDAKMLMSPANRVIVDWLTCDRRPLYTSGDPVLWFQATISNSLGKYKKGLDELSKAWGWERTRKNLTWLADVPASDLEGA